MRFRHARGGLVRDIRDLEIERLRGQLREARAETVRIRAEERERFSQLSAASKRFAASMRSRMDEKQRQQRRLDAQYAISRIVEEAGDLVASGPGIFRALGSSLGWEAGVLWTLEEDVLRCAGIWHPASPGPGFEEACEGLRLRRGEGLPGRVWQREEACWVEDLREDEGFPHKEAAAGAGLRCALAFPIQDGGRLVGVFELLKKEIQPIDEDLLRVAYLAGHQIGQLVERRRAEDERDRALARETEARRTIEDRERRYRTLTANIPGAVFRCVHPEGRPTMEFVSGRIEEITGHPAAAFLPGGDRSYLDVIHPEDPGKNEREVWRALERGSTYNIEYRVLHADGGVRWVNERGSGIFSEDGHLLWIDGAIFDVTDRKEAEAERDFLLAREWVAKAEAAERERISRELHDRVAHSMAVAHQSLQLHEVLAGTDARRAESKLDLAREMIKASLESTRNLSAELRRLDAEEDIEAELRHLLDVAVPPGIQAGIRVEGDEATVPGHVRGQLFLVMREAVRNAVSHSGCGSLSVGLDITPERVIGSVEDDGRGFDAAGGNGGVGLRSMRERAALLDGALELDCEPGRGTRVEVSVPLAGRG